MQEILRFLITYEVWIYIILGVVVFTYLRKLILAFQDWQSSVFGLEKEISQRKFSAALTFVGLLVFLGFAIFVMVSFVAPTYPSLFTLATPTLDLLATPTVTLEAKSSSTLMPLKNPVETQAVTTQGSPGAEEKGCIKGQFEWTFPATGDELSGTVELKGTVNVTNLGFYKYEFSQAGSNTWVTIAAGDKPKTNEPLGGVWNTSQLIPGDYLLRLVVSDNQNQVLPACQISVRVVTQ
jgi:hypothetical protein